MAPSSRSRAPIKASLLNRIISYYSWYASANTPAFAADKDGKWNIGVMCIARVSYIENGVVQNWHEDVGYGSATRMPSFADAMDKCRKEAMTDARKRALRVFGPALGQDVSGADFQKTALEAQKRGAATGRPPSGPAGSGSNGGFSAASSMMPPPPQQHSNGGTGAGAGASSSSNSASSGFGYGAPGNAYTDPVTGSVTVSTTASVAFGAAAMQHAGSAALPHLPGARSVSGVAAAQPGAAHPAGSGSPLPAGGAHSYPEAPGHSSLPLQSHYAPPADDDDMLMDFGAIDEAALFPGQHLAPALAAAAAFTAPSGANAAVSASTIPPPDASSGFPGAPAAPAGAGELLLSLGSPPAPAHAPSPAREALSLPGDAAFTSGAAQPPFAGTKRPLSPSAARRMEEKRLEAQRRLQAANAAKMQQQAHTGQGAGALPQPARSVSAPASAQVNGAAAFAPQPHG